MDSPDSNRRPKWVWAIAIFFFISAAWTLVSLYLIGSGKAPMSPEQRAYFDNLTVLDYGITILTGLLNLLGAIALFFLRKTSFYFFIAALLVNAGVTISHVLNTGWVEAIGDAGLIGATIGWGVLIAVCSYSWNLMKKGILT